MTTHTAKNIIVRLEADRDWCREQLGTDAAENSFFRVEMRARITCIDGLLAWLPKELARVESDTIDEVERLDRILDLVA